MTEVNSDMGTEPTEMAVEMDLERAKAKSTSSKNKNIDIVKEEVVDDPEEYHDSIGTHDDNDNSCCSVESSNSNIKNLNVNDGGYKIIEKPFPENNYKKSRRKNSTNDLRAAYSCRKCREVFKSKSDLVQHMKTHPEDSIHSCLLCNRSFMSKFAIERHMTVHRNQKLFQCSECGKKFKMQGNLQNHMKEHTGGKSLNCDVCGKGFTRRGMLNRHMIVHTKERPFECANCGKCFGRKAHLYTHMVLHSNEKPHACSICGKAFRLKSNLTTHVKSHKRVSAFSCIACGKGFKQQATLDTHMKKLTSGQFYCSELGKIFDFPSYYTSPSEDSSSQPKTTDTSLSNDVFEEKSLALKVFLGDPIVQESETIFIKEEKGETEAGNNI